LGRRIVGLKKLHPRFEFVFQRRIGSSNAISAAELKRGGMPPKPLKSNQPIGVADRFVESP
jgi:hypothetical protein